MDCELAQRHLDAYVDGELSPTANLDLETHLGDCDACQAHVEFVHRLKHTLQRELRAPSAPVALRASVQGALVRGDTAGRPRQMGAWASAAAAAAAACVWYVSGAPGMFGMPQLASPWMEAPVQQASIFGSIVERHQERDPAEIDTPEPDRAERWFSGKLQFRVRPVAFSEPQVRFVGARLTHIGPHRAAKLYYDVGNRRLTAVAFEATPEVRSLLEQRSDIRVVRMGERTVRYHSVHGYTVPIIEHNGILYGFTGDMDERRLLRLVSTIRLP